MAADRKSLTAAMQVLAQKCAAFADAVKVASKESAKIGSGMKNNYNELMSTVISFAETLPKSTDEKDMLRFPVKLACCTLLDGVTYANGKTKALLATNVAVQHLFGIIEFLYSMSLTKTNADDLVRIHLDSNEVYIYVDILFKIFETVSKLEKVENSVHLRVVETILQLFSSSSPIMEYDDIIRRSFLLLDGMLKNNHVRPIVEGGMMQLADCVVSARRAEAEANVTRKGAGNVTEIAHMDLVVEIISCCCTIIRTNKTNFMTNLGQKSASEMLLHVITMISKGVIFQHPSLRALTTGELYSTLKYILTQGAHIQDGCMLLARVLCHGYHYINRGKDSDRDLVKPYETLFDFIQLERIDTSTVDGMHRKLAWLRAMALLMQSNDMLNDIYKQRKTRKFMVDMLKYAVRNVNWSMENELDAFFDGMYSSGNGQQLISEQIDLVERESDEDMQGYIKLIPLFAVKLQPGSSALDVCNLTTGVANKFSRFTFSESKELGQLQIMESAITIDMILSASQILYSLAVGANRHLPQFVPYRIFYHNISEEQHTDAYGGGNSLLGKSEGERGKESYSECSYLKEAAEISLKQLERMTASMKSEIMQEAFLTVQQSLLVVFSVSKWTSQYVKCLESMTKHVLDIEKGFMCHRRNSSSDEFSLYLLHVRALNALVLNYPVSLNSEAWEKVMRHILSFMFISHLFGVTSTNHMRNLIPMELDEIIVYNPELHDAWKFVLLDTIKTFERMYVHDATVVRLFVAHFGFNIAIPLLARSSYALNAEKVHGIKSDEVARRKLDIIQNTLDAWPEELINMIEQKGGKWSQFMHDLANSLERDSLLASADSAFLLCLFGTIADLPFVREHDELMLHCAIFMLLLREPGQLEQMIDTICNTIVSLLLSENEKRAKAIDAAICVLHKAICDNTEITGQVIHGLKMICITVPQILAATNRIANCLVLATKKAIDTKDISVIVILIDVVVTIVENSVDSMQDESCIPFVECMFMLAHGSYEGDKNAAFRVIGVILEYAEKMAAQSHFFGGTHNVRLGEEEMWSRIFKGLCSLGLSEFSEVRQCSIKSFAMFIKGRINRFDMVIWKMCCSEMLFPLADGLVNSSQPFECTQVIFTVCDEFCVALREVNECYREDCDRVMTTLISGMTKAVSMALENKDKLPKELHSALGHTVGIATNVIIDYLHSENVWSRCIETLQLLANSDHDLIKQNIFKSVCSILAVISEKEPAPVDKVEQTLRLALGDATIEEQRWMEALCDDTTCESLDKRSVLPPWIFMEYPEPQDDDVKCNADEWVHLESTNVETIVSKDAKSEKSSAMPHSKVMSKLCHTLKSTDDDTVKITLRDKIQNSLGILQEMQMLQLVTLHYNPQILAGTDAIEKVAIAEIPKSLAPSQVAEGKYSDTGYDIKSTLSKVLRKEGRKVMMDNIFTHMKVPPLMSIVDTYGHISRLFKSLVLIKNPEIYETMVKSLVSKYFLTDTSNIRLSIQLMDNIAASIREVALKFLEGASEVITEDMDGSVFLQSKEYMMFMNTVLGMVPMLLKAARHMIKTCVVQPVCIMLYQQCINVAMYVYFGIYVHVHFLQLEPIISKAVVDYWNAVMESLDFFSQLNFKDVDTRIKYIRMLHAVTIEMISSLVINPFSICPPFVYGGIIRALDFFAKGKSSYLRRIALQRLSDASCYPFIPVLPNKPMKNNIALIERVRVTKLFLLVLVKHIKRLLKSEDDIEVIAAIQILEGTETLPCELIYDQEYLRKHKYLKHINSHPLVSAVLPYLLELIESDSKKVLRATRRVMSIFLEEMGAQVALT
ncbi:hypothetical protein BgAZ_203610 [Babesia gibsoni]|uniref:Uncharacterized protein n=1 Tax=Babesia gibsoni TaxID=33632 RepID=A0AAD8LSY7_BABGI|nr:hypothetical protein BgAZ_203610 [Babesia gibsoni]